jgi:uncharacterized membrane protein YdjX (TVP38/TMEM64 family)
VRNRASLRLALVLVLTAAFLVMLFWLPVGDLVWESVAQLRALGPLGAVPFALLYMVATLTPVPITPLSLASGFLYGPFLGFAAAWSGEVVGAVLAWALGRGLLREHARRLIEPYPTLGALDEAVATGGFKLVVLVRLSPVFPFGPMNYALGLTAIRPLPYISATALGTLPLCSLLVYAGSTLPHLNAAMSGEVQLGTAEWVAYWGGLIATGLVVFVLGRATRKALRRQLDQPDKSP